MSAVVTAARPYCRAPTPRPAVIAKKMNATSRDSENDVRKRIIENAANIPKPVAIALLPSPPRITMTMTDTTMPRIISVWT